MSSTHSILLVRWQVRTRDTQNKNIRNTQMWANGWATVLTLRVCFCGNSKLRLWNVYSCTSAAGLTMCQKERQAALGWKGIPASEKFVPSCKPDGEYDVVQCYLSVSVCWCVDKNGIEKQGTRTSGVPSCGMMGNYIYKRCHWKQKKT